MLTFYAKQVTKLGISHRFDYSRMNEINCPRSFYSSKKCCCIGPPNLFILFLIVPMYWMTFGWILILKWLNIHIGLSYSIPRSNIDISSFYLHSTSLFYILSFRFVFMETFLFTFPSRSGWLCLGTNIFLRTCVCVLAPSTIIFYICFLLKDDKKNSFLYLQCSNFTSATLHGKCSTNENTKTCACSSRII